MLSADQVITITKTIIDRQKMIIGPLAIDQAKSVSGLFFDESNSITIKGDGKEILTKLVQQFETLFGQASVEACKDAVKEAGVTISDKDLPDILK